MTSNQIKQGIFVFLFCFTTAMVSFAQNPAMAPVPGYAVLVKGDTIKGDIKFRKKESYSQNMSVKFPDQTSKSVTAKTATFVKAGNDIFESFEIPGSADRAFFHRLSSGKVDYYEYDYEFYQMNNTVVKTEIYMRKDKGELIKINSSNFKKKAAELMSDNTGITSKLDAKDVKIEELLPLVKQYNGDN